MKVKTQKVLLSDFRGGMSGVLSDKLLPLSHATVSYNFDNSNGALKDGVGIKELIFPNGKSCTCTSPITAVYYYRRNDKAEQDQILIYCQDKCVYSFCLYHDNGVNKIEGLTFEKAPFGQGYNYNGKDVFLFSSQEGLFLYDGETVQVGTDKKVSAMSIHNERLFICSENDCTRLRFSDDFNPLNFSVALDQGGYIDFQDGRGGIKKLISALGYLYIFRSYGISRLSSFYEQSDFSVSHLFLSTAKIYEQSVTACESGIIFLSGDGLYKLTESTVTKIFSEYDAFLSTCDNSGAKGLYYNGKFYLICNMMLKGEVESVVLVCDLTRGTSYLSKNLKVKDFCGIYAENFSVPAVIVNKNTVCTFDVIANNCGQPLTKVWETPITSLGVLGKEKTVKKIEVCTNVDLTVTVCSEKQTKKIKIKKGKESSAENLSVRGKQFKFIFSTNGAKTEICLPQITFSYLQ